MNLPELKSKPIKGVPEEEWHLWTIKRITAIENGTTYRKGKPNSEFTREAARQANLGNSNAKDHRKGRLYIELTTGFIGTQTDIEIKYGITASNVNQVAARNKPIIRGKNKGLHFQVHQP